MTAYCFLHNLHVSSKIIQNKNRKRKEIEESDLTFILESEKNLELEDVCFYHFHMKHFK